MKGLCKHDRSIGHVCLKCPTGTAEEVMGTEIPWVDDEPYRQFVDEIVGGIAYIDGQLQPKIEGVTYVVEDEIIKETYPDTYFEAWSKIWGDHNKEPAIEREVKMNSGLDCDYYDFPGNIHSAQDMIEWLNLNFANGNILKSLIRESGAATKETDQLYEAEKRYYFAGRELERVRNLPSGEEARQRLSNGSKTG